MAHGNQFNNRMGRHSGLGPNEVEGYSSINEQKSLRSFFTDGNFEGLICETGFNGGHSAANYLVPTLFGQDIRYLGFDLGRTKYSHDALGFVVGLHRLTSASLWSPIPDPMPS